MEQGETPDWPILIRMTGWEIYLFDDGKGLWGPLTDLRAVFELRSGALTTCERIETALGQKVHGLFVPERLCEVLSERNDVPVNGFNERNMDQDVMIINGRWLATGGIEHVKLLSLGCGVVQEDGQLVAGVVPLSSAMQIARSGDSAGHLRLERLDQNVLIERPWDILAHLETALFVDLDSMELPVFNGGVDGLTMIGGYQVKIARNAKIHPHVVIDSDKGPVVIDESVIIGSFSVIAGPCYIGPESIIPPHAHIRANTAIGPRCVVGGEVSHSVIHGYTNKGHSGYLGHSLVGQWVNLGAGTSVSNLKNTYGNVQCQLEGATPSEDSTTNKFGSVIGDYVRTAIGTRLTTGACIGTGSMLALSGFVPKHVDRFAFSTDAGTEIYDMDRFIIVAQRAMARRKHNLTVNEQQLLRHLT
ncbi:MAG: hypothetical protein CMJ20_14255 [Phycisphaeraceae bacterium]|nr:hypothetical protein [Phycisphaeraceae bacterium]|tara:strand:- start:1909 stop:3159 length:1251 start_codon:yes stop_codon:yes gene_type:complete